MSIVGEKEPFEGTDKTVGQTSQRDQIAIAALAGILACFRDHKGSETVQRRCAKAYEYADEMLRARKQ